MCVCMCTCTYVCTSVCLDHSWQVIKKGLLTYPTTQREEWVISWPGQVVLCVSQQFWTAHIHKAIKEGPEVRGEGGGATCKQMVVGASRMNCEDI